MTTTYQYVGDLQVPDGPENVYGCPDCGALVPSMGIAKHDASHAKVAGMFRMLDHLMLYPGGGESS